ncbi:DNA-binding protein [Brumimicrobium salinarum]|uniref:DNA-binding protein n=1 Tax=Brumimicrobium salinarum TaxID=2058658 RepID=A0A2I0R565_9FLAO|nr:DUF3276 family protein [Brumimicrobium salinarum]PKR81732.1 DNA-binding protein [Brumimicrobium salinarum]
MKEKQDFNTRQEVDSTVVKAGKRTYFFDIKATKNNDLYLTITESKKSFNEGKPTFQKHKIFLYKEDFEKFRSAFDTSMEKIETLKQEAKYQENNDVLTDDVSGYSSVDFEDLD